MAMNALNQRRTNNRLKNISLVLGIVILTVLCLVLASCGAKNLFAPEASTTKPAVSNPGSDVQATNLASAVEFGLTATAGNIEAARPDPIPMETLVPEPPVVVESLTPVVLLGPTTQTLSPGENPPSVTTWLQPVKKIEPAASPFEWTWMPIQDSQQEWVKCPFPGQWCRFAARPALWIVIDSSGIRVRGSGFDGPNVTVIKIGDTEPQVDVWLTDGQIFTFGLSEVSEADVLAFAEAIALHTGSSNRQTISIVKAY